VLASVAGVGLPGGASYFAPITPVFLAFGLPTEAIPVLFAVDTIPDMIETVGNVTADMATAAIVSRRSGGTSRVSRATSAVPRSGELH
jgi:Na+/H+-dicarboxylate symporter